MSQESEESSSSSCSTRSSKPEKPRFENGEIIGTWKVLDELGSGGIGVVYKVLKLNPLLCERTSEEKSIDKQLSELEKHAGEMKDEPRKVFTAALKSEAIDSKKRYSETLKVEARVLRKMCWSDFACRIFMAGRLSPTANVIVMTQMGPSLSNLRRIGANQRFTLSTAVRVIRQAIEALENLHSIGYIHRDVKPSNFAIGLNSRRGKIHLLDFGFARPYLSWTDDKLEHRAARTRAPFMGTDRYCSVNVHNRMEQGRRDDMWSLYFMFIELMKGKLPWRSLHIKEVLACKIKRIPFLLDRCPWELLQMYEHLCSLEYASRPDYGLLKKCLDEVCMRRNFKHDDPLDWEEGGRLKLKL